MAIIGKIIGGGLGFALGGPLGALLGASAGHLVDKVGRRDSLQSRPASVSENQQMHFAVAFVVLAAKLSKADGRVTQDEVTTIRRVFHIPSFAQAELGAIFNEAKNDSQGFEPYAMQISQLFHNSPWKLETLLGSLVFIAAADGVYHSAERQFISDVARIFGIAADKVAHIEGMFMPHAVEAKVDPYEILGVGSKASNSEVKAAHRKILKESHPDLAVARGMPDDFVDVCNQKMANANAAYDQIKKERGL